MRKWNILKKFIKSHPRKLIIGTPIIFLALMNVNGFVGNNNFSYHTENNFPIVGDEIAVVLDISTKEKVNAVGGVIDFSADTLHVVSTSRITSLIDLWPQEPSYSNTDGELSFSGGILGAKAEEPLQGTIITVNFNILKEGKTSITLREGQILASDGEGTNIFSQGKTLTLYARKPGTPSPDINHDGTLSAADVNTLYFKTFGSYDGAYDLNGDKDLNWADVKHLLALL